MALIPAGGLGFRSGFHPKLTVRREVSGTETYVYTQTWSIDNRLIGVTKALTNGAMLAQTNYFFDGDGVRVRKDDPDGTTSYAGPVEQTIGPGGTTTAEYFDDITGTSTLTAPAFAGAGSSWRRGTRP